MGVKTIWSSVQSYWEVGIPSKNKGQHCTGSTTSTWMCGIAFTLKMYASCLWLSDREPRPIRLEGCRWVILIHFPYFPQDILLAIRQSKGCPQISSTASTEYFSLGSILHEHFPGRQSIGVRTAPDKGEAVIALQKGKHGEEEGVCSCWERFYHLSTMQEMSGEFSLRSGS